MNVELESLRSGVTAEGQVDEKPLKLSLRRFFILIILILALFSNGEAWMTFGSVTSQSMRYYNKSEQNINWFGNIFLLAYAIEAIPCTFMPQLIGLRYTLLVGCMFNFLGSLFRIISLGPHGMHINSRFILSMTGNLFFGFGQGFLLNLPSLVSARWFGDKERSLSTSFSYMANTIGVGIGFVGIFLAMGSKTDHLDIERAFLYVAAAEMILNSIVFGLACFILRESPKNPPSKSEAAALQTKRPNEGVLMIIKCTLMNMLLIMKNSYSLVLIYVFSAYYACYTCLFIFLSAIIDDFVHDTTNLTGYMGSFGIILSGIFTIIIGYLLEKTNNKYNKIFGTVVNGLCLLPLLLIILLGAIGKLNNTSMFITVVVLFGFCTPFISIGCELLADITYPIDPNISSNSALIFGNIFGVLMTYLLGLISGRSKYFAAMGLAAFLYLLNIIILASIKFPNKRSNAVIKAN